MKIRNGKLTDKKEYLKTQKEAFPNINTKRDSKFFEEKIKNKEIFVLEEKGEYAGHICFGKHLLNPPFVGSIFIEELAVKEKFRGKGFGTKLMEKLVKFCKSKKIPTIHLGTGDTGNSKVMRYYEKQGFKKVGWLKDINPNSEYNRPQFFYAIMIKDWKKQ
ncbi:GNAT family N-acetyltransferase [Patescibacteria group bacterium]|nr:GNAT family N-acetyltransferase [Patescibacteria group bacterium]